jgi:hypothetical protein
MGAMSISQINTKTFCLSNDVGANIEIIYDRDGHVLHFEGQAEQNGPQLSLVLEQRDSMAKFFMWVEEIKKEFWENCNS